MNYAIVELKYVEKRMFIVSVDNIQSSKPKVSSVDPYFCYISTDLTDEPDFDAKYFEKFDGTPGVFKVFIRKMTKTFEEAALFLKEKRMQIVPKKYRQPSNTDAELKAAAAKKKKTEKKLLNDNKKNASAKNSLHLAEMLSEVDSGIPTVGSKFEELVKGILEEHSDSDSENDSPSITFQSIASISNDTEKGAHAANSTEYQANPRYKSRNSTLPQQLNQNQKSTTIRSNIECKKTSEIVDITPLPFRSTAVETDNRMNMAPKNLNPIDRRPEMANTISRVNVDLSANSVSTNKTVAQICKPLSETKIENSSLPLQLLSETCKKQAVMSTGNALSQMVSGSKEKQKKRKINEEEDIFRLAQKPKLTNDLSYHNISANPNSTAAIANDCPSQSQTKTDNVNKQAPKYVFDVSEVINIDEMVKQKETLENEYLNLKGENESLKERNVALQNALVTASKSAVQVSFDEEVGGRRYNCNNTESVFLNTIQCKILDSIDDHQVYLNNLILAVFGAETLKKSSVTGAPSNRTKAPSSPALDPTKLKFIYDLMAARTEKSEKYKRTKINRVINKKIANLRAVGNGKPKHKKKVRAADDDVDLSNDICERNEAIKTNDEVNSTGSSNVPNTSELANISEFVNTTESNNPNETTNASESLSWPESFNPEPTSALNYVDLSFLNNANSFGGDSLMLNIDDLPLVDLSTFENANCLVFIENSEN